MRRCASSGSLSWHSWSHCRLAVFRPPRPCATPSSHPPPQATRHLRPAHNPPGPGRHRQPGRPARQRWAVAAGPVRPSMFGPHWIRMTPLLGGKGEDLVPPPRAPPPLRPGSACARVCMLVCVRVCMRVQRCMYVVCVCSVYACARLRLSLCSSPRDVPSSNRWSKAVVKVVAVEALRAGRGVSSSSGRSSGQSGAVVKVVTGETV